MTLSFGSKMNNIEKDPKMFSFLKYKDHFTFIKFLKKTYIFVFEKKKDLYLSETSAYKFINLYGHRN